MFKKFICGALNAGTKKNEFKTQEVKVLKSGFFTVFNISVLVCIDFIGGFCGLPSATHTIVDFILYLPPDVIVLEAEPTPPHVVIKQLPDGTIIQEVVLQPEEHVTVDMPDDPLYKYTETYEPPETHDFISKTGPIIVEVSDVNPPAISTDIPYMVEEISGEDEADERERIRQTLSAHAEKIRKEIASRTLKYRRELLKTIF